jgi:hypothetical protein
MTDDDPNLEGNYVYFEGAFNMRASVAADGSFSFDVIVPPAQWGQVTGTVTDAQGLSFEVERTVTVT